MDSWTHDEPVGSLPHHARRAHDLQARLGMVLWLGLGALVLVLSAL
jgi:hypothetical protein